MKLSDFEPAIIKRVCEERSIYKKRTKQPLVWDEIVDFNDDYVTVIISTGQYINLTHKKIRKFFKTIVLERVNG